MAYVLAPLPLVFVYHSFSSPSSLLTLVEKPPFKCRSPFFAVRHVAVFVPQWPISSAVALSLPYSSLDLSFFPIRRAFDESQTPPILFFYTGFFSSMLISVCSLVAQSWHDSISPLEFFAEILLTAISDLRCFLMMRRA